MHSGIQLLDDFKLAINLKKDNDDTVCCAEVTLSSFSLWSKFHVNMKIGPEVMKIFDYKRLAWNSLVGNNSVWVLLNIWRLENVRDTKFGTNVSNKMLLNARKYQGHSFYCFRVIKVKPTGWVKINPAPTQIRVRVFGINFW